jgi:UDP-sulfoquinovose synthase
MKIIVFGGDGFCGWPTTLRLASKEHSVLVVDNLSRRQIDKDLGLKSLTNIYSIHSRIKEAKNIFGDVSYKNIDIAKEYKKLKKIFAEYRPDAVIQFAEQRSAPYSMVSDYARCYTINNNINATHNICSAIVETDKDIHLIHLGTMGVYGYSKGLGVIPEGYLDISVPGGSNKAQILYPTNPGSIYHMTKSLDQIIFQFYNKNWKLRITDLHQGIVWGTETKETKESRILRNRFDYDGIYGTVLNRFIVQAANGHNLSVYGTGGQKRAFININDTAECIRIALENSNFDNSRVRIFNQVSEVRSVLELAKIIESLYGSFIDYIENPRKELKDNDLEVINEGLTSLGFEPILLSKELINDINLLASITKNNFDKKNVLNSPKW